MKKNFFAVFLLCAGYAFAQDTTVVDCLGIPKEKIFTIVEEMPQFNGGNKMLNKLIADNIRFPAEDINGTVYVNFIITKDGSVCDPKIIKGLRQDLDDEALRVVKLMPQW